MDELFVLVYFLIALNMFVIMFMGYKECQKTSFDISVIETHREEGMEADNIFIRNR